MNAHRTVFVVDDDSAICDALSLFFRLLGLDSKSFRSAAVCLDALSHERPDCIVTDLRLGGALDGPEFIERLRAGGISVPVIALTACNESSPMVKRARSAGARTVLYKPYGELELEKAVWEALDA